MNGLVTGGAGFIGSHRLFASSGGTVAGEQEAFLVSESHLTRPLSPYGVSSKLTCEHDIEYYRRVAELKYVALRLANVSKCRRRSERGRDFHAENAGW